MEKARFRKFYVKDENPLSGNVKRRLIFAANEAMREIHEVIMGHIRSARIAMPSATGGIKGGSPINNVLAHRKRDGGFGRYFYLLDLSSAYKNLTLSIVMMKLHRLYPSVFDRDFIRLVMEHCILPGEGLITGGSASPDIFNLCMEFLIDTKLRALADKYDMVYTRYLDDLTFSADKPIGKRKRNAIIKVLLDADCVVNHGKTQILDSAKQSVQITGVGLRDNGQLYIPRRVHIELVGLLHRAITKKDIPRAFVAGKMAMFVHLSRRGLLDVWSNETEEKLYRLYLQYRNLRQKN